MHHDPMEVPAARRRHGPDFLAEDRFRGCVVLTVSSGHSADYLLGAVAAGRENYYTGAVADGEPPGRWYGTGAEALGLSGLVDAQDMTALYEHYVDPRDEAFKDPSKWGQASKLGHSGRLYATAEELYAKALNAEPYASPERREQLRLDAAKKARSNVAFLDATFSVQKSVTVLHTAFEAQEVAARRAGDEAVAAAWLAHREAVEAAIWAGNQAALDYLAEHAGYSRVGHHGGTAGRFVDAHDWTVASFFQHDSRDHDPQLHIHNAILNRVQGTDGHWRTLDGRAIFTHRGAAAAVGERTMEEHLARSLGVRFETRPDGKAREIIGVRAEVMDLFSSRRRAVTAKTATLVAAFEAKFGRSPNALERDRLQRQATFATRRVKSHEGESFEERLERWDRELRAEVAGGLAVVAADVLNLAGRAPEAEEWSPSVVVETALADVQAKKAAWTESDLARAISDALPAYLGGLDAADVRELVDGLTAEAIATKAVALTAEAPGAVSLPEELRLADGRSAYDRPGGRLYATAEHLTSEQGLRAAAVERGAVAVDRDTAAGFITGLAGLGIELGADQAAAVRGVLTSGAKVETLVGPAGTGKSFVVGALAKAWQDPDLWDGQERRVVGLATSQIATEVLAGEGLTARNVSQWLAAQRRLASGTATREDRAWRLLPGDLVVVDESAMTATADLAAIREIAAAADAKLLLTGDPRQLAAVGAAGGMDLAAQTGLRYELAEARRFTHEWERAASLRLREGDQTALQDYRKHGRIIDAGTAEQAEAAAARAFLADMVAGRRSLLIVDTNEQAAKVSARVRAELVRLGRVTEAGVPLGLQGTFAGVGDVVQARFNGWHLAGYGGNRRGPINRERYRVLETREDGGLVVAPILGTGPDGEELGDRMTLPGSYVTEHVALGYASTVHAAQGLTVDASHLVATGHTGPSALYVGMSRGRHANTAYVTTLAVPDDAPTGTAHDTQRRDPLAVLATAMDTAEPEQAATAEAEASAANARSVQTAAERLADVAELAAAGRTAAILDALVDAGRLTQEQRYAIAADDGMTNLARLLRQAEVAGHDPEQVLTSAIGSRAMDGARSPAKVLYHRITESTPLDPVGDSFADWTPKVTDPAWQRHLDELAAAADQRQAELGAQVAEQAPQWAVETLGPVPENPDARDAWESKAGVVAAHREFAGYDDPTTALPGPPKPGQVEAYASWRAAWRALGRPEAERAEAEMSDGQLRVRIRAYAREEAWGPAYVAPELSGTAQAEARQRQIAELRAAEAAAATDQAERARLEQEAADAAALAEALAQRRTELEDADVARAEWYAHTAETRAAAQRAENELGARGINPRQAEDTTIAEEWLAAHRAEQLAEDPHRQITDETDLTDTTQARAADTAEVTEAAGPETGLDDIRAQVAAEPPVDVREEDWTRVATAEETADAITRAQRALTEVNQRRIADERREAEEARTARLARWHDDDLAAADAAARDSDRHLGHDLVSG